VPLSAFECHREGDLGLFFILICERQIIKPLMTPNDPLMNP